MGKKVVKTPAVDLNQDIPSGASDFEGAVTLSGDTGDPKWVIGLEISGEGQDLLDELGN